MRSMAKVLIAVSCLVLATGAFAGMIGDLYEIPMATVAPVIDGEMDAVWHNCGQVFQRTYTNGTTAPDDFSDLMGWSRVMWDNENIYLLLYTQDDVIQDVHANTYERDSWEVYFDGDNSKTVGAYDNVNDLQIRFGHGALDVAALEAQSYWGRDGVEFAVVDNPAEAPSGWMTEIKLPLAGIFVEPVAGSLIGFELQQNDNDGTARESVSKWWVAEGDPSWNNASTFGTAVLTGRPIGGTHEISWMNTAPQIDGYWDDIWEYTSHFQANSSDNLGSPGPWPDSYEDSYFHGALAWDDCYLYGIVTVWDDVIVDEHPNTYEQDGLEFFIDGNNSKGRSIDGVNDMELRFNHHFTEVSQIIGPSYFNSRYTELAVRDNTDPNGWTLEFKMPLPRIYLEPVAGSEFGLEIQLNDNDGTQRDHISKWWLDDGDETWRNPSLWGTAYLSPGAVCCGKSADDGCLWDGIEGDPRPVPERFYLEPNHPNPFNPKTKIVFTLPSREKARLSFYDAAGNELAAPVDGVLEAGRHETEFDGTGLSSGVYFCKLRTADRMQVRKMMLVK
jgi:hypothetical protein